MRWDWYQATVYGASPEAITRALLDRHDLASVYPGRAKNGYLRGVDIKRGDVLLATVWWGGNPGVHVKGTGEHAPHVDEVLNLGRKRDGWEVLPSRVDACIDWVEQGLFDRLYSGLAKFAMECDIKINQQGDWERGKARTAYFGARSSTVQLVLYEKGYESGGDPNWVRLEVRVFPARHARSRVASWGPSDALNASRWLTLALMSVGFQGLKAHSVGTVWRPSDDQRARRALLRQYGAIMEKWAQESGGWSELGEAVKAELRRMEVERLGEQSLVEVTE